MPGTHVHLPDQADYQSFATQSNFPTVGESNYLYLDESTGKLFRWTGTLYVEVAATEQKFYGKLTQAQINLLTGMTAGDTVYNTTEGRNEVYHGVFGWVTTSQRSITVESNTIAALSTGSNFYFGNMPITASTTLANREFLSPYTGKVTGAFIRSFANSVSGNRDISVFVVVDGVDYLVATVSSSNANREFVNTALGTTGVPVTRNVSKIALKAIAVNLTGTQDSTNILFGGTLIVQ